MDRSRYEETRFTQQLLIDAACDSLYEIGFDRHIFSVVSLSRNAHTCRKFLDLIEPISNIKDLGVLRAIFADCREKNNFLSFKSHMDWLKTTPDGRQFLDDLLRHITEPLKKSDIDLARTLVNYGASCKQTSKNIKEQIDQITLEEQKLEAKVYAIDTELKDSLGPLFGFKELSVHELRMKAYELYEKDCQSKGINPIPCHRSNGFETAVAAFGETAKEEHFLAFLNEPSRRMEIAEHISKGKGKE